jgi:TPR repeat protein
MNLDELLQKAEAGSCVAQSVLGISYLYGYEVEVDYQKAFRFLCAAANQGGSRATLNLGCMYAKGLGVPKNVAEAIRLFEAVGQADDSSDAFAARIELGRIYNTGSDFPVDVSAALKWYKSAIALAPDREDSEELREAKAYVAAQSSP